MINSMLKSIFKKKEMKERSASSIDDFRTGEYRVFLSHSYFSSDLERDIRWHKKHLKRLTAYQKNPGKFHKRFPSVSDPKDKERHFKEQVIESIPFHQKILEEDMARLNTILSMMPRKDYKKIVKMTKKHKGLPEYFVYSKFDDDYFFVVSDDDQEKKGWSDLVKNKHRICNVVFLN